MAHQTSRNKQLQTVPFLNGRQFLSVGSSGNADALGCIAFGAQT